MVAAIGDVIQTTHGKILGHFNQWFPQKAIIFFVRLISKANPNN
jgi:hypothetical protein